MDIDAPGRGGDRGPANDAPAAMRDGHGTMMLQISNSIVRLHATQFGRGPTKAKAFMQGDVVVCLLEDIFTTAERTLIEAGHADQVREMRLSFQEAMRGRFTETIEEITGRRVRGFFSQVEPDVNAGVEVFLLHPDGLDADAYD